jgi:translation elongation factor EF-Tu-like GTPase
MWPFRRQRGDSAQSSTDDMSVDTLLTRANQASPSSTGFSDGTGAFRMTVEDVFFITGRGLVATGRIEAGTLITGTDVRIMRAGQVVATTEVSGIEQFRKVTDSAGVGENVGVLLKGLAKGTVARGDVLTA